MYTAQTDNIFLKNKWISGQLLTTSKHTSTHTAEALCLSNMEHVFAVRGRPENVASAADRKTFLSLSEVIHTSAAGDCVDNAQ